MAKIKKVVQIELKLGGEKILIAPQAGVVLFNDEVMVEVDGLEQANQLEQFAKDHLKGFPFEDPYEQNANPDDVWETISLQAFMDREKATKPHKK